jgi:hypothetical protein
MPGRGQLNQDGWPLGPVISVLADSWGIAPKDGLLAAIVFHNPGFP